MKNLLYYGDNLPILRNKDYFPDQFIDLIYLDPPFNSNTTYNVLFSEKNGTKASAQIKAFEDTWHWDRTSALLFQDIVENGPEKISQAMQAFRMLLGDNDMMAYLSNMAPRLLELHRVLKKTGSLYLHCDSTASHYLKIILDAIFNPKNFRNEIIWRRTSSHGTKKSFGPIHDTILFYVKTNSYHFRVIKLPYMKGHVENRYTKDKNGNYKFTSGGNILTGPGATLGESGKTWRGFNPTKKNRHWAVPGFLSKKMPENFMKKSVTEKLEYLYQKGLIEIKKGSVWPTPVRYLEKGDGHPIQDIWAYQPYTEGTVYGTNKGIDADVAWLGTTDPERLGYPTQKPEGILERIIRSSCPKDGIVLDPFCGCGTAVIVSEKLNRNWIGIDITHLAISLIKHRLEDSFGKNIEYDVIGEPASLSGAKELAHQDRFQFQWWILGKIGAKPIEKKKGADRGVDGRLYFHIGKDLKTKQIVISVKSGHVGVKDIRDLRGVIEREKAEIGVLITLEEPTKPMIKEAVNAGFYSPKGYTNKYSRIQILTVEDIFQGKKIDSPRTNNGFKIKQAQKRDKTKQSKL